MSQEEPRMKIVAEGVIPMFRRMEPSFGISGVLAHAFTSGGINRESD